MGNVVDNKDPTSYVLGRKDPPRVWRRNGTPGANDRAPFTIGDLWWDRVAKNIYIMTDKTVTAASWEQIGGATGGPILTLTGNSGGAIPPDAGGDIDVIGGVNGGVLFAGAGSSLTGSLVNTVVVPATSITWTTLSLEFDGIAAGFADSELVTQQAGVGPIAAATTTTVQSITLADPQTITAVWTFSAALDPATEAGGGTVTATARRSGGGAVLLGVPVVNYNSDFAGADSVTADVNANDLRLRYTTGTSPNVNIVTSVRFQPLARA